jgi:hypothetical protein
MCEWVFSYYFDNPSAVSVCLSVHARPCVLMLKQLWGPMQQLALESNSCHICHIHSTYTHSHTFQTFTQVQYSLNSHEKHTHSLKRWKPDENAGWQGRQLVVGQIKFPVSGETKTQAKQLSGILRQRKEKKQKRTYRYTNTHLYVCLYVWLHEERQRIWVTCVITAAQGCVSDLCMCSHMCADNCRACS